MSNRNNPKTFLLCAWNYFERKKDRAKGKKYHWKKDCLVKCLATYFDAMGLREVKTEGSAKIVVVAPRDTDVPLTLDDLFFFIVCFLSIPKRYFMSIRPPHRHFMQGTLTNGVFLFRNSVSRPKS